MNNWWVLNMVFIMMWCISSFTWIIWSCWIAMVMLLVCIYVMCIYVVGEFSYILLVLSCWCKHVLKCVSVDCWTCMKYALFLLSHRSTHCWCRISYPCWWRILCIQLSGVIILGDYDVFVASWGDDLGGNLVPHMSRFGLGTLHV